MGTRGPIPLDETLGDHGAVSLRGTSSDSGGSPQLGLIVLGILSWPAVDAVIRTHLDHRANLGYHLWGLVVLFLWMKHWGITAPSRSEEHQAIPVVLRSSA